MLCECVNLNQCFFNVHLMHSWLGSRAHMTEQYKIECKWMKYTECVVCLYYYYRWEVKCCRILSVCMQHCYLSDVLANFTDDMPPYTARPDDRDGVFVGMYSKYDRGYK